LFSVVGAEELTHGPEARQVAVGGFMGIAVGLLGRSVGDELQGRGAADLEIEAIGQTVVGVRVGGVIKGVDDPVFAH
jgi:hypothetical protein